jgi:DNA-binding MarR family transcriptional regulator
MKDSELFLEKSRAIRTLVCLLENEGKGLDDILESIGGSKTTGMKRLTELVEMKLVERRASQDESRKMIYSLTDQGKRLATQLGQLVEMTEKVKQNAEGTRE